MATDGNPEVIVATGNHSNAGEEVPGVCKRKMGDLEREIYLQVELYADEENDCTEIKRKKRMARAALTTWKESIELNERLKLQRESEMRSIMNEVYNLVSLYSVFEGVVFTAVATSSRLECQHLWSPVGLSLFVYSMVVVVAFTKFKEIGDLEEKKAIDIQGTDEIWGQVSTLREVGYADFDFGQHCKKDWYPMHSIHFWKNALGLTVPLSIFTAGLVVSLIHILCWN